jgi:hypothetical protein
MTITRMRFYQGLLILKNRMLYLIAYNLFSPHISWPKVVRPCDHIFTFAFNCYTEANIFISKTELHAYHSVPCIALNDSAKVARPEFSIAYSW